MILVILLARTIVGLSPYSGIDNKPNFGDFECHRVWMEVTHNLNTTQWYVDSQYSNINYWPMDYPPLCAYTHKFMAKVVSQVTPDALKLGES